MSYVNNKIEITQINIQFSLKHLHTSQYINYIRQ